MEPAPPHLIVIDPDPLRRARLLESLRKAGHTALPFSTQEEASAALRTEAPDVAERRYRMLFTQMLDAYALHEMVFDEEGCPCDYRFLDVNPAFERLTGIRAEDIVGKRVLEVLPGTEPRWIETYGKVVLTGEACQFENFHAQLGKWFEVLAFRPQEGRFVCVFRDITGRKRQEDEIAKLNRLYAVLSQVNQAVARARSRQDLFETICRIGAEFGHFRLTWIGLVDPASSGSIGVVAYSEGARGPSHRVRDAECGIAARAVIENRAQIREHAMLEPSCRQCRGQATEPGIGSCAAFPIHLRGQVHGVLCLHADEPDFFSPAEIHLLQEVVMDISYGLDRFAEEEERVRAERELRESEERFSLAFYKAPVIMVMRSIEDGTFVEVNEKFEAVSGFSREEAIGRTAEEIGWIAPKDDTSLTTTVGEGNQWSGPEVVARTKDGRQVIMSAEAVPITVAGVRRALIIAVDVTYRKLYETERETMLQLLRILNAPNDTQDLIRMVTGLIQESSGCEAVGIRLSEAGEFPYRGTLGFPAEFVEAESRLCTVGSGEAAELECLCGAVLCGRLDTRLPNVTPGGTFWSNSTSEFLADVEAGMLPPRMRGRCMREGYESLALVPLNFGGRIIGLLQLNSRTRGKFTPEAINLFERAAGSLAPAIEQRRAQSELRESEERYRRLYEGSPLGYQSLDTHARVVDVNPAWCATLGYTREEVVGRWFGEFLDPSDVERFRERFPQFKESGETHAEFTMKRKDGSSVIIAFDGRVSRNSAGGFFRTHCVLHDVTEARRAEAEKARLSEQLMQAQKLESIGRLAGGVAHDFNNLLTVINGYSDLMLSKLNPPDPLRRPVEEIQKAGFRAAALTQRLLAFSRKQVVELKPLDLNQLITEDGDMLRRLVGETIEAVMILDPSVGLVIADKGQLNQVLMNLVVNACDAMPRGGKLTIETAAVWLESGEADAAGLTPGGYVRLTISDTGVGMERGVLDHIFEPFFTTKGEGKGTGLGLSTAYGIIRQCGGRIRVYSEPGRGTAFKIDLPCAAGEAVRSASPEAQSTPAGGTETILVVEDQAEVRTLTVEVLRGYGYRVLEAALGGEALRIAEQHPGPIHLMLTDMIMPYMTGRELAGRVKSLRPDMAVVFMSGYSENAIAGEGAVEPGTPYVTKPFSPPALAAKVREVLGAPPPAVRILVTDDDEGVRGLFRSILEGEGYEVYEARDGDEALTMAREYLPDIVLIDLVMPNREGIETIPALRKNHPGMKIVAVSGAFGGSFLKAASIVGADRTVLKPVTPERLLETLRGLLPHTR